jgi:hypothetical protein
VFHVAPNFKAEIADVINDTVTLYRFVTPGRPESYTAPISAAEYRRQHIDLADAASKSLDSVLVGGLKAHTNGEGGSPFLSLGLNPFSIAESSDNSGSGVQTIVSNAARLEQFAIPKAYLLPGFSDVAQSETEIVALLPPGVSLARFRTGGQVNPYLGFSRAQIQQALAGQRKETTSLTRDVFGRLLMYVKDRPAPAAGPAPIPVAAAAGAIDLSIDALPPAILARVKATVAENLARKGERGLSDDQLRAEWEKFIQENKEAIENAIRRG